jgi:hypothetical protein
MPYYFVHGSRVYGEQKIETANFFFASRKSQTQFATPKNVYGELLLWSQNIKTRLFVISN